MCCGKLLQAQVKLKTPPSLWKTVLTVPQNPNKTFVYYMYFQYVFLLEIIVVCFQMRIQ